MELRSARGMKINSQQIDELCKVIQRSTGTDLVGYCPRLLISRISERMVQARMDADQYLSLCRNSARECADIVNAVTIHVSHFFRNPVVFEILAQSILPHLISNRKGELRVWSAGCAAGEEVYSAAILVDQALKNNGCTDVQPQIFATDIDPVVLAKAAIAVYTRECLKDTRLGVLDTYFSPAKSGFLLSDTIREMVHFSLGDLLSREVAVPVESIYGSFDLILCRNVLIYFSARHQRQVLMKLHDALASGGYLVLGDSEGLVDDLRSRFRVIDAKNRIYMK